MEACNIWKQENSSKIKITIWNLVRWNFYDEELDIFFLTTKETNFRRTQSWIFRGKKWLEVPKTSLRIPSNRDMTNRMPTYKAIGWHEFWSWSKRPGNTVHKKVKNVMYSPHIYNGFKLTFYRQIWVLFWNRKKKNYLVIFQKCGHHVF